MAENEKEQLKKFIHQLPNAVNGDGKAFVAQLKKALSYLSEHAGGSGGGGEDSGEGEDVINQVTALRLMEIHTVDSSGFPKNNIEVTFDNSNIENYAFAQVWVKDDTENNYQQHGNTNGTRYLFENALVGRTYTVKVVVQLKDGRTSDFDNAPTASILIQGSVLIPDAPTQFFLTWDEDGALWQWQYEENEYIDFFELRLDANAGVYNDKLLDRTRLPYSRANPNVRSGTAYLFIRNIFGDYSLPATHIFNKPVAAKPNKPVLQATLDGVVITMSPLPTGYQGYVLEIDGEEFKTINRQFVYYKFSGTVKARYCYYDEIGRGEWSEYESITIKVVLDPDELPEISYDAFDQTIKDAIDAANNQQEINEQMKADVESTKSDIKDVKSDIEGISADISEIQGKVEENSSAIIQTDERIETVVTQKVTVAKGEIKGEILDEIGGDIKEEVTKEVGSQIKQEADNITATVYELVKDEVAVEAAAQVQIEADKIKSTVYTKTEVDGKLDGKANASDVYTKEETASQISQTAEEVKVLVYKDIDTLENKVDENTADIKTNASSIAVNAQGITALSASVSEVSGKVNTQASEIKVLNDQIALVATKQELNTVSNKVDQNTASIELANDSITSVVSKLNGTAQDSGYEALTGLASSIVQTSNSITSVVTELNKDPEDCSYTAITQLKDGIDLSVKNEDLTGKEIISRINISPEVITIDGKYVHVTGDTVFDNGVIVGGYIKADTIYTDHLKTNAVTTAKIASNAITTDKIKAGAITNEKITDKSISSVKIEDGAITVTKIADGAVGSTKIEGGAITTEHIQAGSIIGEHISAGAISADKLYAGDIDITGELALVGGAVRLDENGLTCQMGDGAYTLFDSNGITYFNKLGFASAQIRQMCIGYAEHGKYVKFNNKWDSVPDVVCVPTELQIGVSEYAQTDILLVCNATNITQEGFYVQCYTKLSGGSSSSIPINAAFNFIDEYEYEISNELVSGEKLTVVANITSVSKSARAGKEGFTKIRYYSTAKIELYNGDSLLASTANATIAPYPDYPSSNGSNTNKFTSRMVISSVVDVSQPIKLKFVGVHSDKSTSGSYKSTINAEVLHLEYATEGEHIISTGTALFVATTGADSGYSVIDGGATYGLRNQVRQG